MKIGVVSGLVRLPVKHVSYEQYQEYGRRLIRACEGHIALIFEDVLENMWLSKENPPMVPNNPVPEDRYAGPVENVLSNIVQHNRTHWAMSAAKNFPDVEVWVWLDCGILKQGAWTGNPVTEEKISRFLHKVATTKHEVFNSTIPFPGIEEPKKIHSTGHCWRFCGSTHIWPRHFLPTIDREYKACLRAWITMLHTTPLDLPIWAMTESLSELPFEMYKAEYDASQLDNYPYGEEK